MYFEGMKEKPSWISKVIITIEQVRDHLHHRLEEAHFVAWHAAKDAKLVRLYSLRSLLLEMKSVLPCKVCLLPVLGGKICNGRIR
jgi:hypothetical protein